MKLLSMLVMCLTGVAVMLQASPGHAGEPVVFVSSFSGGENGAILTFTLSEKGVLTPRARVADIPNPFYMALSPDHQFLYSIFAPRFGGTEPEQVAAFRIEAGSGQLTPLNRQSTRGTASCFLEVDATGQSLLAANYTSGSVVSWKLASDGSVSEPVTFVQHHGSSVNPSRQKEPHAHCFVISPDNRFAFAADLGTDQIMCYELNASTGVLTAAQQGFVRTPPGAGPRHLTFHPNGRWMYVINELANSVTRFDYAVETGFLTERQTISTIPSDFDGTTHTADIRITPNGRFLYGTNRGHDSIAAYEIREDGSLQLIEITPSLGRGPQNLLVTKDGRFLLCANMPGNNVVVFRIDSTSGQIRPEGTPVEVLSPSCIRIME